MVMKMSIKLPMLQTENSSFLRWVVYPLAAFPLINFGLQHWSPALHSIWNYGVLLCLFVVAAVRYRQGFRPLTVTWTRFAGYYLLLGAGLTFAVFWHPLLTIAGYRIDVLYILVAILIPFAIGSKDITKLLYLMCSVAVLIGLHGVYQYVVKTPVPSAWMDVGEHLRTRVFSVFLSCNELGAYMALMLPVIGGFVLYDTNRTRKWLLGLGMIPCALTLVFTFSRAAWFSLGLAVVIVAIVFERRLLIVLAVLFASSFLVSSVRHRITDLLSPIYWIKSAHGGRVQRWHQAFQAMRGDPLFGAGPGHYGGSLAAYNDFSLYSDNYYAKILGEAGLVGLILFLAMHISLLRDLWSRVQRTAGRKRLVFLGGLTGLLSVLIHNMFENVFEYPEMSLCYFFLMAIFLVWGQTEISGGVEVLPSSPSPVTLSVLWTREKVTAKTWIAMTAWSLFVTLANLHIVTPLVLRYDLFGVFLVILIGAVWLVSVIPSDRKRWVQITLFDLLLGQVISRFLLNHWRVTFQSLLGILLLFVLAWLVTKLQFHVLLMSTLAAVGVIFFLSFYQHLGPNAFVIPASVLLSIWIIGGLVVRYLAQRSWTSA
ncbi:O-antigen ligase family protein [Alicyclobacillus ferrooxydans]|uniref:O-antigen ligase family protein n=1 Tax=Alicyclobacillus ferrooxydans TaxID=471514 RepID=UPI0006D52E78|nr:O-antigen ligase family protein [Alicyclobacillus ferrooxydans]